MSRILCLSCQRPEKACICRFITPIDNRVLVVVLQHPSEVKQVKGTVALLSKSLQYCQVIEGDNFTDNKALLHIFSNYNPVLLYPSEQAEVLTESVVDSFNLRNKNEKPLCLLILDGTWKKAYRMFMLSKNLHNLRQVCLPEELASAGQYLIRKVAKNNALSSLEACCYALSILENDWQDFGKDFGKYNELLNKFSQFNQFQLSFRPN